MHFYQKNIPDFNNATRHLTRVERSLFSDAIELYYDTEKPLITDFDRLARLLLAHCDEEKTALRVVLAEFFILTDDGYFNKRCNEEILKYQAYMESKSKAGKASAEQRAKHKSTGVEQVLNTTSTNYNPITNNQYPITKNQEPLNPNPMEVITNGEDCNSGGAEKSAPRKVGTQLPQDWQLPKAWGEWAMADRPEFNAEQIRRVSENFRDFWLANANQAKAKKSDWQAAWRNWFRKEPLPSVLGKSTGQQRIENTNKAVSEFLRSDRQPTTVEGEVIYA